MLKPYVCVACEKVIIAQDGVASLIALFSKIILTIPAGTEIPRDAVAPKEWAVFSIWDPEPGDDLRKFFLCTQILYPDETQFGQIAKSKFNIEPNKRSQMNMQIQGFPIGQAGEYKIRSWIEENDKKISDPIQFGIEVIMNFTAAPTGASTVTPP
ncbi:MAG TPA: hypothetical protein VNH65_03255 [Candidatus Acidoferrum sp.]|nr:hypothetical protein [Candidatus Acidoferrum sp.]